VACSSLYPDKPVQALMSNQHILSRPWLLDPSTSHVIMLFSILLWGCLITRPKYCSLRDLTWLSSCLTVFTSDCAVTVYFISYCFYALRCCQCFQPVSLVHPLPVEMDSSCLQWQSPIGISYEVPEADTCKSGDTSPYNEISVTAGLLSMSKIISCYRNAA